VKGFIPDSVDDIRRPPLELPVLRSIFCDYNSKNLRLGESSDSALSSSTYSLS
jgi:hypothetical protein